MKKKITILTLVFSMLSLLTICVSCGQEKSFTNDIGMEFVLIPAGSFMMGANPNVEDATDDETPVHKVKISRPFYLGKYEVTQGQWDSVMGSNISRFKGMNNPVERVSWDDVQEFIRKLNEKESRGEYRFPTEAEWEYAARAGTHSTYSFGDDASELGMYAWYWDNSEKKPHPVGQKQPNPWGLYDMHGNVYEWVQDRHDDQYYANSPEVDPKGGPSYAWLARGTRGGAWTDSAKYCRSAARSSIMAGDRSDYIGFRLAFSPGQ